MTTKEKIISSAEKLFSQNGYEKTTTKMIAQDAGVNETTIFRCFNNKLTLLNEVTKLYISGLTISPELSKLDQSTLENAIEELSEFIMAKFYDNQNLFQIQLKIDLKGFDNLNLSNFLIENLEQYLLDNDISNAKERANYFVTMHLGLLVTRVLDFNSREVIDKLRRQFVLDYISSLN